MTGLVLADAGMEMYAGRQLAALRRMRTLATGLLLLMLAIFIACTAGQPAFPWLAYPRAFSEAAMIGACADWFAIVSLFRHPLGIPIPHTAIVPRHKTEIAEGIGRFISRNFLAPEEVAAKIETVDTAGWLASWLKDPNNVRLVASRSQGLLPPLLEVLGEEQTRSFSRDVLRNGIDSIALAPLLGRVLSVLVTHGHHETLYDRGIDASAAFLKKNREDVRRKIASGGGRWIAGWVAARLSTTVVEELAEALAAARGADHPWRSRYRTAIDALIAQLAEDPVIFAQCERLKSDVLSSKVIESYLAWLSTEIEAKVKLEMATGDSLVASGLEHGLASLGHWLDADEQARAMINDWTQRIIVNAVVPNRQEIGAFVTGIVERWDTDTLVEKMELQFGKDLQYIRINGTLVGGLVGLAIFTVTKMFGFGA